MLTIAGRRLISLSSDMFYVSFLGTAEDLRVCSEGPLSARSTSLQDLRAMFECIGLIDEPEKSFLRTQCAKRSENALNHRLWN
jgi:hypothetical protein